MGRLTAGLLALGLAAAPAVPARAQAPADPDAPRVAGTDVPAPKRKKLVVPEYPEDAKLQGVRGIVLIEVVIERDGRVGEAHVVRSIAMLDEAALEAVRQWEYEVSKVDDQPVRVRLTVPITFSMKLPEVTRAEGVPELRSGAVPVFASGETATGRATVAADVTLDPQGKVGEVLVTRGESPWTDAVLRALRTWIFEPDSEDALVKFKLEADLERSAKDAQPRATIRLSDPRRTATVEPPTASASSAPVPTVPGPAAEPSPAALSQPTTRPTPPPIEVIRVPTPPPPPPTAAAASSGSVAPDPAAPAPPRSTEPGISSVRDVALGPGVPDLTQGRRPVVPPVARMGNVAGTVMVEFSVGTAGATLVSKVEGPEPLKVAAQQMVGSWQFRRTSTERLFLAAKVDYAQDSASASVTLAQ